MSKKYCGGISEWRISFAAAGLIAQGWILPNPSDLAVTVDDLPDGAVAQTTGTAVTLDATAAGYGWFVDATPGANEEFLPTSNPNEWVAKAGTEAANKMDLLSVLLHEYGHALGIEHSADGSDFMAATLLPGVRRLPSADELSLMAQLAGQAKLVLEGSGTPDTPLPPSLPVGGGLSALLVGRLRRTAFGSLSPVFDSVQIPAPRYEVAANPTLANPEFAGSTGWSTTGTVSLGNGAAVLSESATAQTRLNQVFVLGEHDRFLSFTVANGLQANGSPLPNPLPQAGEGTNGAASGSGTGPSDAFEVALIDANTGLSLMGGTGLTKSDAIVNRQTDGREFAASGVISVANPDGSRTYLVDLAGIAAGTVVNLSFDLIGFGRGLEAQNSRLTIRDLRLGVPQTANDSATLAEDTPAAIDALANDLNARQPGFEPVIVSGPAHGRVAVNAGGSFSFTPEQDWYGQDSFTYKLSDGRVDSNLATVNLTITPVNDAPVANALTGTLAEDGVLQISLLTGGTDVDGDALAARLVAALQHGRIEVNADGSVSFIPAADFNGTDSFTYLVNDGQADSNVATVEIVVTPVNDAPIAMDTQMTAAEDASVNINLIAHASDVDGDTLTAIVVADFGFSDLNDTPANGFASVIIGRLPVAGSLMLDGQAGRGRATNRLA